MIELTFLGTGTSNGIPMIGCHCPVCESDDPRDKRMRCSVVVRWDKLTVLIDTSPELRLQSRTAGLERIDAVLFTHAHADHTAGIDDLRRFNELAQAHLPVWASPVTAEPIGERYGYAFVDTFNFYGGKPDLLLNIFEGPFDIGGRSITPVRALHGTLPIDGFRFGNVAYLTDVKTIPEESLLLLAGLEILVINALRERPHPTHLNVAEALEIIELVQPKRTWLTHLSHELGHEAGSALLPPGVEIAYDGLVLTAD